MSLTGGRLRVDKNTDGKAYKPRPQGWATCPKLHGAL